MGQKTFGLMFGCPLPKLPAGKQWWGDIDEKTDKWVDGLLDGLYKPGKGGLSPKTDESREVVGFFVAVGASGMRGVPDLEGPLDITDAAQDKRYAKAIERARENWKRFVTFCDGHGVALLEPRLWLVETDVS